MSEAIVRNFGLTSRDLNTIRAIFEKYPGVKLVHIFGSRAKGNYKSGSDIDLAIMNEGVENQNLMELKRLFAESSLPYRVDLIYYPKLDQVEFINHIDRVGKLFYEYSN